MINEALPAVPIIIVYKHKTIFKLFKKIVWNCSLCFVSFLSVKPWTEETALPCKNPCFPSKRSMKICTCLHLLHANIWLKARCVEGLLPKLRAFLTHLHVHYINNLSAKYCIYIIEYTLYLCVLILHFKVVFILHRNNVSLQTNIFFEPYLDDICAM